MTADKTKLSSGVTVSRYRKLVQNDDRQALAQFVRDRFDERYFRPIESTPKEYKHGFTTIAVCCLVIETLESFYQGLGSTKKDSWRMFRDFFARGTGLNVFGGNRNWFYNDIRCGILHQGESRNGWRIVRIGALLDVPDRRVNATKFIRELHKAVDAYADELQLDDALWKAFKVKMEVICNNCVGTP
jgi:hypothetical protein